MNVDNIVIPGGILATWDGPQSTERQRYGGDNDESFDIVEIARERARSLSVAVDGPSVGRRRSMLEQILSTIPSSETIQTAPRKQPSNKNRQRPRFHRQRSNSINLGGLARSRATGLSTPANPGLRLEPTITFQDPLNSSTAINLDESYVFQRLDDCPPSYQDTAPLSARGPFSIARSRSVDLAALRRKHSDRNWEGISSKESPLSSANVARRASIAIGNVVEKVKISVTAPLRRSSLQDVYEKAKIRQVQLRRSPVAQFTFQYVFYLFTLAAIYFIFVGFPLWKGLVLVLYNLFHVQLAIPAGTAVFLGIAFLYAYLPLLITLEKEPPKPSEADSSGRAENGKADDTALLIPCYKSEKLIGATLEAALKVFPAQNIFVIANGNSPTPLDNTAAVCDRYGVSHTWSPIGSKIVAQFVGCHVAKRFPYVLLIDDDCLLPPNFPIVTERIRGRTLCIGYTIKSVGPESSKGTLCQQAQDIEYKLSGLQRAFAGKIGSATFPHGAISIWDRKILIDTFQAHPGFSVSEDWFFGHVARGLGCRIQMCTAVFVETETPSSIFFSGGGARGGFGEMTIWKQRFFRWNYFFVSGIFWDMAYIIRRWKLGGWELGAKIFVFQEVYETLLYLLAPFVIPISFIVRPLFSLYLYVATLALYQINVFIFNYVHLRARNESVSVLCLIYYLPYKIILTFVNIASCYYSIYKYAKYFAKRHPKVVEDEKAIAVVLRLEEESYLRADKPESIHGRTSVDSTSHVARRFTITAVGTNLSSALPREYRQGDDSTNVDVVDFASRPAPVFNDQMASGPPRSSGCIPPNILPSRRPFSWHRSTSRASSSSGISPFEEHKQPHWPLPFAESSVVGHTGPRRHSDRMPPTISSSRRPFSWYRSTSKASSSSGISPFEEHKTPHWPLPSSESAAVGPPLPEISLLQNRAAPSPPPPAHRSLSKTLRRSPSALRRTPSKSTLTPHRLLRHFSSSNSDLGIANPTPTTPPIQPPPPAAPTLRESYHFVTLRRVEENIRRRRSQHGGGRIGIGIVEPDIERYISALADTGNPRDNPRYGSMDRLFIREEDEDEEDEEEGFGSNASEYPARRSTQTDRSSWRYM